MEDVLVRVLRETEPNIYILVLFIYINIYIYMNEVAYMMIMEI